MEENDLYVTPTAQDVDPNGKVKYQELGEMVII